MNTLRQDELYRVLSAALKNGDDVILYYQGKGAAPRMRRVTPQTVMSGSFRNDGYVNGFCHFREEPRTFSFSGIVDYLLVDRVVTKPLPLETQALNHMNNLGLNTEQASLYEVNDDVVVYFTGDSQGNNIRVHLRAIEGFNKEITSWTVTVD